MKFFSRLSVGFSFQVRQIRHTATPLLTIKIDGMTIKFNVMILLP